MQEILDVIFIIDRKRAPVTVALLKLSYSFVERSSVSQLPSSASAPDVVSFCTAFGFTDSPVYLPYHDAGYGPDWCHVSAKHNAMNNGGKRVHGWALWQYPSGVMGDFHSVWENSDGTLIDVTPSKFDQSQVLFVRDRITDIYFIQGVFTLPTNRMSPPSAPYWWNGSPTADQFWGLPPQNEHFDQYCKALAIPVNELETTSPFG